jgi:hypothetical protein
VDGDAVVLGDVVVEAMVAVVLGADSLLVQAVKRPATTTIHGDLRIPKFSYHWVVWR